MLGNDLDDKAPPRCLVHYLTVAYVVPSISTNVFKPLYKNEPLIKDHEVALMNDLAARGLSMVLYGLESDPLSVEEVFDSLSVFHHPFTTWLEFKGYEEVSRYLAVQPDVKYVVDRSRPIGFGSRSLNV